MKTQLNDSVQTDVSARDALQIAQLTYTPPALLLELIKMSGGAKTASASSGSSAAGLEAQSVANRAAADLFELPQTAPKQDVIEHVQVGFYRLCRRQHVAMCLAACACNNRRVAHAAL